MTYEEFYHLQIGDVVTILWDGLFEFQQSNTFLLSEKLITKFGVEYFCECIHPLKLNIDERFKQENLFLAEHPDKNYFYTFYILKKNNERPMFSNSLDLSFLEVLKGVSYDL
jgi:hypothetical protein